MDIYLKDNSNWAQGCYSFVYFDFDKKTALKIFRKKPIHDSGVQDTIFVCADEIKAYEKIWCSSENDDVLILRRLVPRYYSCSFQINAIIDSAGQDISGDYCLGLNYSIDYLSGKFTKINKPISKDLFFRMNMIPAAHRDAFRNCGIYHIHDASTLNAEDGNIIKYIDFRAGCSSDMVSDEGYISF